MGIDWIHGSSGVVVMAEVPCSTYMGGVMCQVLGYELSMPSGKIVRRMEPRCLPGAGNEAWHGPSGFPTQQSSKK